MGAALRAALGLRWTGQAPRRNQSPQLVQEGSGQSAEAQHEAMFHGTAYQEMTIFLPFNKAADPYLDRMLLGRLDKELQARKKSADNWRIHLE